MEKAFNTKIKTNFQAPLRIKEINFKYPKSYRPGKKDKAKRNN